MIACYWKNRIKSKIGGLAVCRVGYRRSDDRGNHDRGNPSHDRPPPSRRSVQSASRVKPCQVHQVNSRTLGIGDRAGLAASYPQWGIADSRGSGQGAAGIGGRDRGWGLPGLAISWGRAGAGDGGAGQGTGRQPSPANHAILGHSGAIPGHATRWRGMLVWANQTPLWQLFAKIWSDGIDITGGFGTIGGGGLHDGPLGPSRWGPPPIIGNPIGNAGNTKPPPPPGSGSPPIQSTGESGLVEPCNLWQTGIGPPVLQC